MIETMAERSEWRERVHRIGDEPPDDYSHLTPDERIALVWDVTMSAWAFKSGSSDEPRLRRDVERLARRGR